MARSATAVRHEVSLDALVLRDWDADGVGVLEEWLWVVQDINYNVMALVNDSGAVVERYAYNPHGEATILAPNWTVRASSNHGWRHRHQGCRVEGSPGAYEFRHRWYSPTLMCWLQQDPIGFEAGDNNRYRYVGNNPTNATDPSGLKSVSSPLKLADGGTLSWEAQPLKGRFEIKVSYPFGDVKLDRLKVKQWVLIEAFADYRSGKEVRSFRLPPEIDLLPPHADHHHKTANAEHPDRLPGPPQVDHGGAGLDFSKGPYEYADPNTKTTIMYSDEPNTDALWPKAKDWVEKNWRPSFTRAEDKAVFTRCEVRVVQWFITTAYVGGEPKVTVVWKSTSTGPAGVKPTPSIVDANAAISWVRNPVRALREAQFGHEDFGDDH